MYLLAKFFKHLTEKRFVHDFFHYKRNASNSFLHYICTDKQTHVYMRNRKFIKADIVFCKLLTRIVSVK